MASIFQKKVVPIMHLGLLLCLYPKKCIIICAV